VTGLHERLFELAASGRPLVVDLDQVSFMDSAGLAALVGTAKRAAARRQPARGLRAADDPRAVPPDGAGMPDIGGPHPGRGLGGAGGSPDHTQLRRSR